MASSDNLASIEPWSLRSPFAADPWLNEAFSRDTDALTKALQKSFSGTATVPVAAADTLTTDALLTLMKSDVAPTPTASGLSGGSEPETAPKRQRGSVPPASGKVSKRKSRASKKAQTTFITADPANFRQMVQQVTGVKFGGAHMPVPPILKPEPHRPGGRLPPAASCLPTLDTSAFLLDHHQHQVMVGPAVSAAAASAGAGVAGSAPLTFSAQLGIGDGGISTGFDLESFSSFPTLESWKVAM